MLLLSRCFALLLVLSSTATHAQAPLTTSAILRGKVLDATGAPLQGVRVTAHAAGQGSEFSAISNLEGDFVLAAPPGSYTVLFTRAGFETQKAALELSNDSPQPLRITLKLAPVTSTITVTEPVDYVAPATTSATKTETLLRDVPQSVTVVTRELMRDQMMLSVADVVRYVPGISSHQGENNRDQIVIRGQSTSADFFVNSVRDDMQYYRDLYNVERIEALKGPNAMIFGRGGGGGVVNRVTKEAGFARYSQFSVSGGSFGDLRGTADWNQPLTRALAARANVFYEHSNSFRDFVGLERYGIAPTLTFATGQRTRLVLAYENFHDRRTADRGITSFQGRPADVDIATFYGDPHESRVRALVNTGSILFEHSAGRFTLRNRSLLGGYDRWYQNFVPGAVNAAQTLVALSAYNNATRRLNLFNQTDLTYNASTGPIRHTLLGGFELGRQLSDNFRNSGFFNNSATSILVPYANPLTQTPVTFRQSPTDADNDVRTHVAALYVQDQIELTRSVQFIAGLRFDNFDLRFANHRNQSVLRRIDNLVSPRLGVVVKIAPPVSLYGNYSVSHLPSSGDQFSSLTDVTQQLKPEKFSNYEGGVKWDVRNSLALTAAVYRLDRTNTRSLDPNNPARIVQTGSQRANGVEVGINGALFHKWQIAGGYAFQDAYVTSATASARAGARVAQVPKHSFALWNHYQVSRRLGAGLGVLNRVETFAAIDNTVILPGYTRADAAVFYNLNEKTRLQVNVENLFGKRYFVNADGNTNISPGSPRAIRVGWVATF